MKEKSNYIAPSLERIDIEVEQGIAFSTERTVESDTYDDSHFN